MDDLRRMLDQAGGRQGEPRRGGGGGMPDRDPLSGDPRLGPPGADRGLGGRRMPGAGPGYGGRGMPADPRDDMMGGPGRGEPSTLGRRPPMDMPMQRPGQQMPQMRDQPGMDPRMYGGNPMGQPQQMMPQGAPMPMGLPMDMPQAMRQEPGWSAFERPDGWRQLQIRTPDEMPLGRVLDFLDQGGPAAVARSQGVPPEVIEDFFGQDSSAEEDEGDNMPWPEPERPRRGAFRRRRR